MKGSRDAFMWYHDKHSISLSCAGPSSTKSRRAKRAGRAGQEEKAYLSWNWIVSVSVFSFKEPDSRKVINKGNRKDPHYLKNQIRKARIIIEDLIKCPGRRCCRQDIVKVNLVTCNTEHIYFRQGQKTIGEEHQYEERETTKRQKSKHCFDKARCYYADTYNGETCKGSDKE